MKRNDRLKIIKFYEERLRKYGYSHLAMDYGDNRSQSIRFKVLAEAFPIKGFKILDVGCGIGDFYGYLKENFGNSFRYTGIDVSAKMIQAARSRLPTGKFLLKNFDDPNFQEKFDLIYVCGTLNLKTSEGLVYITRMIKKIYNLCKIGTAFNLTSSYTQSIFKNNRTYYADPGQIFNFCRSLCSCVILRHDYLPNDFTIYMSKSRMGGRK